MFLQYSPIGISSAFMLPTLYTYHKYRVNTCIASMFLALILMRGTPKSRAKNLCQCVFTHKYLGEIDSALDNVDAENTTPIAQ